MRNSENPFGVRVVDYYSWDELPSACYPIEMPDERVSAILGEVFQKWCYAQPVMIAAPTGSGKTSLVIAVGCTGGKHRSVTLTNAIYEKFDNTEYGCKKEHRDIEKDRLRSICRSQEK